MVRASPIPFPSAVSRDSFGMCGLCWVSFSWRRSGRAREGTSASMGVWLVFSLSLCKLVENDGMDE